MPELSERHCRACAADARPLDRNAATALLGQVEGWALNDNATEITRTYEFKNYYGTMAFVNALAWIVHREDHHPEIEVSYRRCRVRYSTHAINGLSDNDFICAARINALVGP